MSLRNYFSRLGRYLFIVFFVTLVTLFFTPQRAQAAITKEVTKDGFKLSGTGTMDVWSGKEFRYYVGYGIPHEDSMDYKVDVTMTFLNCDVMPIHASLYLDDNSTYLNPGGNNTIQGSAAFEVSDEVEWLEIFLLFDDTPTEQNLEFAITVNVRENKKNADIAIYPPENNYDKTTGTFLVTIDDPYIFDATKDSSKYSASTSDASIGKITSVTPQSSDSLEVKVYFAKAGSADFIFKYGNQTQKVSFKVAKTVITVSKSITLKVGDTTMFSNYVFKTGGGNITIKKIKTSNRKIVDAVGGFIIAKKPGTAKVSALVNGKRRVITVIVGKKAAPKPKLNQLQVKVKGYVYYPTSGKTYYTTQFTNKSKSTVTKVKLQFSMTINERMTRTKTFKVNIKPGKTKTMTLDIGKLISDPSNIKVKCLRFWYKS